MQCNSHTKLYVVAMLLPTQRMARVNYVPSLRSVGRVSCSLHTSFSKTWKPRQFHLLHKTPVISCVDGRRIASSSRALGRYEVFADEKHLPRRNNYFARAFPWIGVVCGFDGGWRHPPFEMARKRLPLRGPPRASRQQRSRVP